MLWRPFNTKVAYVQQQLTFLKSKLYVDISKQEHTIAFRKLSGKKLQFETTDKKLLV